MKETWQQITWHTPGRIAKAMFALSPLKTWAIIGSAVVFTAVEVTTIGILWKGGWDVKWQGKQLDYIGSIAVLQCVGVMMIVCSWTLMGVKFQGPLGLGFDLHGQDDDPPPNPMVVTTTSTEVITPPPHPAPPPPKTEEEPSP
jgi:hypothetical protein